MFRKILREDERFRVYSESTSDMDGVRKEYNRLDLYPGQTTAEGMSLRGFPFIGCSSISNFYIGVVYYVVVSFKENALEHIEGCVLKTNPMLVIGNLRIYVPKGFNDPGQIEWKHIGGKEIFDVANDGNVYYVFGNTRIKLNLAALGESFCFELSAVLSFARNEYAAQKIPKFSPKAKTDCEVQI